MAALNQARMECDEAQRKAADLAAIARAANEHIKRLMDRLDQVEAKHRVDEAPR